jgi:hypothetical protein
MSILKNSVLWLAAAVSASAMSASAASFDLKVDDAGGLVLSGVISTDGAAPANIDSFSGTLFGSFFTFVGPAALTGGQPGVAGATTNGGPYNDVFPIDGSNFDFDYDNVFYTGAATLFDSFGLLFTSGGHDYNLYSTAPDTYVISTDYNNGATESVDLTVTPIPEPATWAMLVLGTAMIGVAARRRRIAAPLAA